MTDLLHDTGYWHNHPARTRTKTALTRITTAIAAAATTAGRWLTRTHRRTRLRIHTRRRQTIAWARRSRTTLLALNGFGFLTASIWHTYGTGAGLAAIGAASLILETLASD